jgi:hypothetical protein
MRSRRGAAKGASAACRPLSNHGTHTGIHRRRHERARDARHDPAQVVRGRPPPQAPPNGAADSGLLPGGLVETRLRMGPAVWGARGHSAAARAPGVSHGRGTSAMVARVLGGGGERGNRSPDTVSDGDERRVSVRSLCDSAEEVGQWQLAVCRGAQSTRQALFRSRPARARAESRSQKRPHRPGLPSRCAV